MDVIEAFLTKRLYMNDPSMLKHLDAIFEKGKRGPPKKKKENEKEKQKREEPPKQEIPVKPPTP